MVNLDLMSEGHHRMFMQTYEVTTGTGIGPTVLTDVGILVLCMFQEITHGVNLINLCDCFLPAGLLSSVTD